MATTEIAPRPRPFRVDVPIQKAQSVEVDGERELLFRYDYTRLDASNVDLLLKREKDTKRITEKMAKNFRRAHEPDLSPEAEFFDALVRSGGWRPHGLLPVQSLDNVTDSALRSIYVEDEETGLYKPGWFELDVATLRRFTPERKKHGNDALLRCRGRYLSTGNGIEFMFDDGGQMRVALDVGDPEEPSFIPLFVLRRPESKRRTRFRDSFAFGKEEAKGEGGKIETIIALAEGISFFDEQFIACLDEPGHSLVTFAPKPQTVGDLQPEEQVEAEVPYTDALRGTFLSLFNPMFKVEVAAAAVQSFSKKDRE